MKVIARENYYQEKMEELYAVGWHSDKQEESCANNVYQSDEADKNIHKIKIETHDDLDYLRIKARRIKTWKFRHNGNQGLKVAKRFGMDVLVAISRGCGYIHLWAENLYSDTTWNDRKYLRLLSALIRTADLVTIEQADEEGRQGQAHIELSYRLVFTAQKTARSRTWFVSCFSAHV